MTYALTYELIDHDFVEDAANEVTRTRYRIVRDPRFPDLRVILDNRLLSGDRAK